MCSDRLNAGAFRMKIVVYYRCRPSEPLYSKAALLEQRQAVDKWLRDHRAKVEAEYFETEAGGFSRPQLSQAIEACRRINATLLIARTEAIGSGADFSPRIASVPVAVAGQPVRKFGHTTPAPVNAPSGISLCFSTQPGMKDFAVYLCNGTDAAIRNVNIRITSITSKESISEPTAINSERGGEVLTLDRVERRAAVIVDHYNVLSDGEFISIYDVEFADTLSQRHLGRAFIGTGMIGPKFTALKMREKVRSKIAEESSSSFLEELYSSLWEKARKENFE